MPPTTSSVSMPVRTSGYVVSGRKRNPEEPAIGPGSIPTTTGAYPGWDLRSSRNKRVARANSSSGPDRSSAWMPG